MVWRLRLHRIGRFQDRVLRLMKVVGMSGLGLAIGATMLKPELANAFDMRLLMGFCLVCGGAGLALTGKGTTVAAYAEGATEEMPAIANLCSGLVASAGGIAMILVTVMRVAG